MAYQFIFLIFIFIVWLYPQRHLRVRSYDILDKKGETFLMLSDFHNNGFFPFSSFKRMLNREKPTAIFLLGDLIDRKAGYQYTEKLLDIIKDQNLLVYFVRGNHEGTSVEKDRLWKDLISMGAKCLEGQSYRHEEHVLSGMGYREQAEFPADIYLCHNPTDALKGDFTGLYLAGHTHGGMLRFPFVGAFYVPDQDFFPEYQKGLYELEDRKLLVTSGSGNTFLPLRFLNPIEVVIVR